MEMQEEKAVEVTNKGCDHKNIIIFHVTGMNSDTDGFTASLAVKMDKLAKESNIDVTIRIDSASKIDSIGKDADIILLTPELFAMEEEVKAKYPNKAVKVIAQEDYGFSNAENILKAALA